MSIKQRERCLDVLLALGERMLDGGPAKATTFKSTEI